MNKSNWAICAICYLVGCLTSYLLYLWFNYDDFVINKEIDILNFILSVLALFVGVYIANSLQKSVNKSQIQHEYLISKLDSPWIEFNTFAEGVRYSNVLEGKELKEFSTKMSSHIPFIRNIFSSFGLDGKNVEELENKLESFEEGLNEMPTKDNIIDYGTPELKRIIDNHLLSINQSFLLVLKDIQTI